MNEILNIKSITEFHQIVSLPEPKHPLIGVYGDEEMQEHMKPDHLEYSGVRFSTDMYTVMFKDKIRGTMTYGRTSYDFQHGTLVFIAPGQVIEAPDYELEDERHGWTMMFHPDLIRNSTLERNMDSYTFVLKQQITYPQNYDPWVMIVSFMKRFRLNRLCIFQEFSP